MHEVPVHRLAQVGGDKCTHLAREILLKKPSGANDYRQDKHDGAGELECVHRVGAHGLDEREEAFVEVGRRPAEGAAQGVARRADICGDVDGRVHVFGGWVVRGFIENELHQSAHAHQHRAEGHRDNEAEKEREYEPALVLPGIPQKPPVKMPGRSTRGRGCRRGHIGHGGDCRHEGTRWCESDYEAPMLTQAGV